MSGSVKGTIAQRFLAEIAETEAIARGECPTEASCDDPKKVHARQRWQGHRIEVADHDHVGDGEGASIK